MHFNFNTLALVIAAASLTGCCSLKQIPCDGGRTALYSPCPEKLYEDIAHKTELNVKASIDVLDKVKIQGIDMGLKRDVVQLRQQIDQFSGRLRDILSASANLANKNACNVNMQADFQTLLKQVSDQSAALAELNMRLDKALKGGGATGASVSESEVRTALSAYSTEGGQNLGELLKK